MTRQHTPEYGYPRWVVIRCNQCRQAIGEGNGVESALDSLPTEAITIEHRTESGLRVTYEFCNEQCRQAYESDL
jgi:hypothetical protein